MLIGWVKGFSVRNRTKAYQAVLEFPMAYAITVGTPILFELHTCVGYIIPNSFRSTNVATFTGSRKGTEKPHNRYPVFHVISHSLFGPMSYRTGVK